MASNSNNGKAHCSEATKSQFGSITSTPIKENRIGPVDLGNASFLSDVSSNASRYNLRSATIEAHSATNHNPSTTTIRELYAKNDASMQVRCTDQCSDVEDLDDSVFETTVLDDNDISYVPGSKSESIVYLDLRYGVVVEDENHVFPIASDEHLKEITEKFEQSLKITSSRNADSSQTKRRLWSTNRDLRLAEEEPDRDGQANRANRSAQVNVESKEIKLKVPIPTFLIPVQFRKTQPNGDYSPVTRNVLNTPKSMIRKIQLNCTTTFPEKICGFLESLDAKIVPDKFSDPNALYYRDNYIRKRDQLLTRLVLYYDQKVFDGKLIDTFVSVSWIGTTLKTDGDCEFRKRGDVRSAVIKLSDNIPTASRLRDTLIAELCRAAAWVLNEGSELSMGWKVWAERANKCIPELPLIQINDHYEFVYECIVCKLRSFARSWSQDVKKTICANCHGRIKVTPVARTLC